MNLLTKYIYSVADWKKLNCIGTVIYVIPKKVHSFEKKHVVLGLRKAFIVTPSKLSNYAEVNGKEDSTTWTLM